MKKFLMGTLSTLAVLGLMTGCGNSNANKKEKEIINDDETEVGEQTVIKNQIFEGLEFVNVNHTNSSIITMVVNNTGYTYEGSKFSITIMDENGNVIDTIIDEVKEKMETGTTQRIESKTNKDISQAVAVEYSIISE